MSYDRQLAASYDYCRTITASLARNFYYGIRVLPKPKRDALCAIYAFMRRSDDFSDNDEVDDRAGVLARWRAMLDLALCGDADAFARACEGDLLLPAFRDAAQRYQIPSRYFHDLIDGVEMDLTINSYEAFDDLHRYCYRVASIVGLTCVHVFGFADDAATGGSALQFAEWNGIAFQLTNILRDVREDAERGRVYLPLEDLRRFGFADAETFVREGVARGTSDPRFVELMQFEVNRARDFYEQARPLLGMIDADSRGALWAMTTIYRGLLERIAASGYDVVTRRVGVPRSQKLKVMATAWLRKGNVRWSAA